MTLYMLDTNIVSHAIKGDEAVNSRLLEHTPSELCVSSIAASELRFGAQRKGSKKLGRLIESFLEPIPVLSYDQRASQVYATIASQLYGQGLPIGPMDTLIAAHAMSVGAVMVTNNTKHFERVPGIHLEDWTDPAQAQE